MQRRLASYLSPPIVVPIVAAVAPGVAPALVAGALAGKPGEREFTMLESSKIQAACGLTDLQWGALTKNISLQLLFWWLEPKPSRPN
jgi:hypothetical protein